MSDDITLLRFNQRLQEMRRRVEAITSAATSARGCARDCLAEIDSFLEDAQGYLVAGETWFPGLMQSLVNERNELAEIAGNEDLVEFRRVP